MSNASHSDLESVVLRAVILTVAVGRKALTPSATFSWRVLVNLGRL